MMVCPFCQAEVPAGVQVCPMCGASVTEQSAATPKVESYDDCSPVVNAADPGKMLGLVGMIFGIASLVLSLFSCCCCTYVSFAWIITAAVGLILSLIAMKRSKMQGFTNTQALTGLITSAITIVISVATLIYVIVMLALYGLAGLSGMAF